MDITIPLPNGLSLKLADGYAGDTGYATSSLSKGLLMYHGDTPLAQEAVGFGVPVVKRGLQTIFPGRVEVSVLQQGPTWRIAAEFTLNLVEKISAAGGRGARGRLFYAAKNAAAALIRRVALVRGPLTYLSSFLRSLFGWRTTYEDAGYNPIVQMTYTVDPDSGTVDVEADAAHVAEHGVSEVVIMNEQGGRYFDRYRDASGTLLEGKQIGCWDRVSADEARFECASRQLCFSLRQTPGATLFRGRELVDSRLAWSGFGYSFAPTLCGIRYQVRVGSTR